MGAGSTLGHQLLRTLVAPGRRDFERRSAALEAVQRGLLERWIRAVAPTAQGRRLGVQPHWRWEDFAREVPVQRYGDYAQPIERQRSDADQALIASPVMRYQPTSGSTSAVKWIPYTKLFLGELDRAITAWVGDLYRQFPQHTGGTHYWSLSWIPTEMRGQTAGDINDDMKLLSFGKRLLAYLTQAAPQEIALAGTSDDSMFATLAWLMADENLSFISVWSPTFALGALEQASRCAWSWPRRWPAAAGARARRAWPGCAARARLARLRCCASGTGACSRPSSPNCGRAWRCRSGT